MRLLVPCYDIGVTAEVVSAAKRGAKITAILNPQDGPGERRSLAWARVVTSLRAHGAEVLGYVDLHAGDGYTGSGERRVRTVNEIMEDVSAWKRLYGVEAFFFDDVTDYRAVEILPKVKSLRVDRGRCILNPGYPVPSLMDLGFRAVVVWESEGLPRPGTPAGSDAAWLCLKCPHVPDWPAGLGFGFATSFPERGNPWRALPGYWGRMVKAFDLGPVGVC